MTVHRRGRHDLVDVRECRATARFEIRAQDGDSIILTGYASTFEPYELHGGPADFGWVEQIDPGAFTKTLREKPDLHLLINHEGMALARTKWGTLDLSVDERGLKVVARLDRSDPDVQRLETKMRRGDMDQMSFAFRVKQQTWTAAEGFDDPMTHRLIREVSLHEGDVSIVNFGANPTTTAEILAAERKGTTGMHKTLTLAEALEISSVDAPQRRLSRSVVLASGCRCEKQKASSR
jgi:HK97 family phage prohead protease